MTRAGVGFLVAALAAAATTLPAGRSAFAQQAPPQSAASQPKSDGAQPTVGEASSQAAENCPGHPDAIGTSRVLAIDPSEFPRVGRMQYPDSLPLNDKEVVLTFDDGPLPPYSNQILDILASQCVKATYFLVGEMARAFPATVRRIYEEGHTIGTHSEDHPTRFGELPIEKMRREIDWGISDVSAALGDPKYLAPFFRIPGLARSDILERELAARGLSVFSSDTVADDWHHRIGAKQIIALAMRRLQARGKGILLLHDIHPVTVAALPGLLKELRDNGFRIVQVVPSASYTIAMANKPEAPIVASAPPGGKMVDEDIDTNVQPRWPQAEATIAPEKSALPVPDVAAFEPDAVATDDVGDVQWPAQVQDTATESKTRARSRKHKFARSPEKRKLHVAHTGKEERPVEHARPQHHERAGAGAHHAGRLAPKLTTFAVLYS
jgi:peptidoglycan/xylan/chitin deacetylase (PgdA/CDA1 family)